MDTRELRERPAGRSRLLGASRGERGASAVEYGLLIAGVTAIIVIAVFAFGGGVTSLFGDTCGKLASQTGAASCG